MTAPISPLNSADTARPLRLVLLEDDDLLRDRVLAPKLRQFGFDVVTAGCMAEMRKVMAGIHPDILVLDIGLPDIDGFEVARKLRVDIPTAGIVMLTGRSENTDRVRGLSEGADAYLSKPAEIDVLVATLHSVARRLRPSARTVEDRWRLSTDAWLLFSPSGGRVTLTKTERQLMEKLMRHRNQVILRESLIGVLTDDVSSFDPHRLDSLVHRLRRKVLATIGESLPLDAAHGTGYLLAVE